jgi:hypothetical protein
MGDIKHASFGERVSPKELLQNTLNLDGISGVALVVFMEDGDVELGSAGIDSAQAVFAGNALIFKEFGL